MATRILNLLLYQAGWLACVLGAARGRPWAGMGFALVMLGIHVALTRRRGAEIGLILAAGSIGLVFDTGHVLLGVLRFASGNVVAGLAPPWIVVMWMQFATLFPYGLRWLHGRYLLSAALGASGGPLAFLAGRRMGAVEFHENAWISIGVLAVVWCAAVPLFVRLSERWVDGPPVYRPFDPD